MIVRIDVPSLDVDGACDRNVCAVVVSSLDVVHRRSTQILNQAVDHLLRNLRPGTVHRQCNRLCNCYGSEFLESGMIAAFTASCADLIGCKCKIVTWRSGLFGSS